MDCLFTYSIMCGHTDEMEQCVWGTVEMLSSETFAVVLNFISDPRLSRERNIWEMRRTAWHVESMVALKIARSFFTTFLPRFQSL